MTGLRSDLISRDEKRRRLVAALSDPSPAMRQRLVDLKNEGQARRGRPDLIWELLVRSFSTMGNARGERNLFGNPELLAAIDYEIVAALPREQRVDHLDSVLRRAKVRMPRKKAVWLSANLESIQAMGGLDAARERALGLPTRDAKLRFMKSFAGFGDKYGRNVWMDLYDPAFRDAIAIDERIKRISEALGVSFGNYSEHEEFYRDLAKESGLEPWELDRLLYRYRDDFLRAIEG